MNEAKTTLIAAGVIIFGMAAAKGALWLATPGNVQKLKDRFKSK
jgi:hypothetical protein